eukprot:324535_1
MIETACSSFRVQFVCDTARASSRPDEITANLWRVFVALLEQCCPHPEDPVRCDQGEGRTLPDGEKYQMRIAEVISVDAARSDVREARLAERAREEGEARAQRLAESAELKSRLEQIQRERKKIRNESRACKHAP